MLCPGPTKLISILACENISIISTNVTCSQRTSSTSAWPIKKNPITRPWGKAKAKIKRLARVQLFMCSAFVLVPCPHQGKERERERKEKEYKKQRHMHIAKRVWPSTYLTWSFGPVTIPPTLCPFQLPRAYK